MKLRRSFTLLFILVSPLESYAKLKYPDCGVRGVYYNDAIAQTLTKLQVGGLKSSNSICFFDGEKAPHPLRKPNENDLECVLTAQRKRTGGAGFSYCKDTNSKTFYKGEEFNLASDPPCSNENYVELMTRSLNLVSSCTNTNARDLFSLFAQESSMHMNIVSGTGAGGVGQLTTIAIEGVQEFEKKGSTSEINRRAKEIDRRIQNSPECALLKEHHGRTLTSDQAGKPCQYLAFPRNPLYPLLISAKHYAYYHELSLSKVKSFERLKNKYAKEGVEYIARDLTYYSYNSGHSVVTAQFQAYLKTVENLPAKPSLLLKGFQEHLAENFPQEKRRAEVSGHVRPDDEDKGILNRRNKLEEKLGHSCFES